MYTVAQGLFVIHYVVRGLALWSIAVREEPVSPPSTLAALSEPAFRLYFAGQLISVSGTCMQAIAQQVVIYNLTQSDLALGLVTLAQGLPALLLTPFAGEIVERFPRRQILVATQSVMMVLAFIQAALHFANVLQVWHIVVLSFCLGLANALDAPARQSFVVDLVGRKQMTSGIVLNSIMFNMARVVGPALGGLALGSVGPAWCFFLNGASFLAVLASLIIMRVTADVRPAGRIEIFKPLLDAVRFARSHASLRPLLLLAAVASMFGATFAVLIPAFADRVLHDTTTGTAALATAQGLGAIVAGIVVAQITRRRIGGKFMTWCAIVGPIAQIA